MKSELDTLPGLHFGEPIDEGSVRIHSLINNNQGTLYIQEHNGVNYTNMLVASNDAVFVPA